MARIEAVDAQKREAAERTNAERAERLARAAEEQGRKLLYTTDMQLAPFVWRDDRSTAEQLRLLVAKHIPENRAGSADPRPAQDEGGRMSKTAHDAASSVAPPSPSHIPHPSSLQSPDLRGFEWYYYQHLLQESAAVFSGHDVSVVSGALTANGQLVTLDQGGPAQALGI